MIGIEGDEAERMNRVPRFFFILHLDHGGVISRPSQEKLLLQEGLLFMQNVKCNECSFGALAW